MHDSDTHNAHAHTLSACLCGASADLRNGTSAVKSVLANWEPRTTVPDSLIAFNSSEGEAMLFKSTTTRTVFMQIIKNLETQKTQSLCGAATAVSILNSIGGGKIPGIDKVIDPWFHPFGFFTQDAIFTPCVADVIPLPTVMFMGMTMEELTGMFACFSVTTRATHAADATADEFAAAAYDALRSGNHVAINFLRTGIDQAGGGHWSPLGAYDVEANMFLLLDVSRYKYPPVWVHAHDLYNAMNTVDSTSGKTRGWIIVNPGL